MSGTIVLLVLLLCGHVLADFVVQARSIRGQARQSGFAAAARALDRRHAPRVPLATGIFARAALSLVP